MFNRVAYKRAAKAQLKGRWKIPVLSTVLIFVLAAIFFGVFQYVFSDGINADFQSRGGSFSFHFDYGDDSPLANSISLLITLVIAALCMAQLHFFLIMRKDTRQIVFGDFIDGLNLWWKAIRGFLWFTLWTSLWSLLFFIPGIIKCYSYSMMFFVMAENPKVGVMKSMNISKELTRGYKGDLFVNDLTFLPLCVLSCFTMGIGFFWLLPYYEMTRTNIYLVLKQVALDSKRLSIEDFE
ncbi:MAG: DUF975 family protein [Treponema sp.]|nr:DUF975 family protein [Treponema sp.]